MALPSSGQLTMRQIRNELSHTNDELRSLSLKAFADSGQANFNQEPHAMSEFYGYEPPPAFPPSAGPGDPPCNGALGSGGSVTTFSRGGRTYRTHQFNSSGTFRVQRRGTFEFLIVAGGGGTFDNNAAEGGGGAGGMSAGFQTLNTGTYAVSVGAGGNGGLGGGPNGNPPGSSPLRWGLPGQSSGIVGPSLQRTVTGGGANGASPQNSGGSGGGATAYSNGLSGRGTGTTNLGNPGHPGIRTRRSGGGGGAGAAGNVGPSWERGGPGGAGLFRTMYFSPRYYAGGGGGGGRSAGGSGGIGGGGAGNTGTATPAQDGVANTGGGGGGSRSANSSRGFAGRGGSGVVIFRYCL